MNPFAPFKSILNSLKGRNHRKYLRMRPVVAEINRIEKEFAKPFRRPVEIKTPEFMGLTATGNPLRKCPRRLLRSRMRPGGSVENDFGMRSSHPLGDGPLRRQLISGMALHDRHIAEMATGEGKTLVSTCPLYLNS